MNDRFIYACVSCEKPDRHGERVQMSALKASRKHFLKFGNIDINHLTFPSKTPELKAALAFEIGIPVDVRFFKDQTWVKIQLYTGSGPTAEYAELFWSTLTEQTPPRRWYASIGGQYVKPLKTNRVIEVSKVIWNNVGLTQTPVNQHLPPITLTPPPVFKTK
ncbi:hypothetical protein NUL63_004574 [Salmonella enterica]|nr:hypothetical protein [Salmonella enterica]